MSSETIDPIDLLRDHCSKQMKVTVSEQGILCFENLDGQSLKLPFDTPTAWKMKSGKGFYTLGSLWCLIAHKDLKPGEFMRKAGEFGVHAIPILEKNDVLGYFLGNKTESEMVDIQMRTQTLLSK